MLSNQDQSSPVHCDILIFGYCLNRNPTEPETRRSSAADTQADGGRRCGSDGSCHDNSVNLSAVGTGEVTSGSVRGGKLIHEKKHGLSSNDSHHKHHHHNFKDNHRI